MLDTAFAQSVVFKKLNRKANLKHVRYDYFLSREIEDSVIYDLAAKENRFVITHDRGFKKQLKQDSSAVFIIPSYLTNQQIDNLICNYIWNKDPEEFIGKSVKLTAV